MKKILLTIAFILLCIKTNAQIPNAGFENWGDEITPQNWTTTNVPELWEMVSRSTDSHSGSFAAKMEIVEYLNIPSGGSMSIVLPANQTYNALNGYYQFHKVSNEEVLSIQIYYYKDNNFFDAKGEYIEKASSGYSPFSIDISSANAGTPDSIWIVMSLLDISDNATGTGAYVLLDDLSFGDFTTDIDEADEISNNFSLSQNYPNPFNPTTTIKYTVPKVANENFHSLQLKVFDVLGNEIATLVNEIKPPGTYEVNFDAAKLTSGIYFYTLQIYAPGRAGNFVQTKKMILVK